MPIDYPIRLKYWFFGLLFHLFSVFLRRAFQECVVVVASRRYRDQCMCDAYTGIVVWPKTKALNPLAHTKENVSPNNIQTINHPYRNHQPSRVISSASIANNDKRISVQHHRHMPSLEQRSTCYPDDDNHHHNLLIWQMGDQHTPVSQSVSLFPYASLSLVPF